jgi:hypothetical protein
VHPAALLAAYDASTRLANTGVRNVGIYIVVAAVLVVLGIVLVLVTRRPSQDDDAED